MELAACHCWLVQQCRAGINHLSYTGILFRPSLLGKPAVAPSGYSTPRNHADSPLATAHAGISTRGIMPIGGAALFRSLAISWYFSAISPSPPSFIAQHS